MTEIKLKMNEEDVWPLLISAFRYALGRRTYIPLLISGIINANKSLLSEGQKIQLAEEVRDYKDTWGDLGDACDEQMWMNFCEEIENE